MEDALKGFADLGLGLIFIGGGIALVGAGLACIASTAGVCAIPITIGGGGLLAGFGTTAGTTIASGAIAGPAVVGVGAGALGSGVGLVYNESQGSTGSPTQPSTGAPQPAQNFLPPTNPPSPPPASPPPGYTVRVMGPTEQYPNGYWRITNERGQYVDPSTMKPPSNVTRAEARAMTHVELP